MFQPKSHVEERYTSSINKRFARHGSHIKTIHYVGAGKKVLDVGCASGYLDEFFKKNNCSVVGIEKDEKAAALARRYCETVLIGDAEEITDIPYPEGYFDAIVFADILEHLRNPDLVLNNFKKYLSHQGRIIASIPNIAYLPIRINLLVGKFDYAEYGHLDKTHVRFFTLKTCKKLFSEGFIIEKIDHTGPASLLRFASKLLASEFIIIAKKK